MIRQYSCCGRSAGGALGGAPGRRYIGFMEYVFPILVLLAMLGALGALGLGVINMARGNNPRRSNKLMQSRVMLQALALLLFAVFMLLFRHS
jgi:ABC-type Na+ efflux pump permease subunit